jgi:5-(carboxyamino)imidazole ribonucleotide mutase
MSDSSDTTPLVGIAMGSESDLGAMKDAAEVLSTFDVPYESRVLSAHRTPEEMANYAKTAHERGIRVIIAGAGGAAHLPGMIAAHTPLPVLGVPVKTSKLNGVDSLLSIVQMPGGVPVGSLAINGSKNAGLLAVQILAAGDQQLQEKIVTYKNDLKDKVAAMDARVQTALSPENL